jgi:predicted neuraminidase
MRTLISTIVLFIATTSAFSSVSGIVTESIFSRQNLHTHGSSIVECPNGDLLACWFYGTGERKANDVIIQGARYSKSSQSWSNVFTMADFEGFPDCNPVLFINNNKLFLFWIKVIDNKWEKSELYRLTSTDYLKAGAPKWSGAAKKIEIDPSGHFAKDLEDGFDILKKDYGYDPIWAEYAPPYYKLLIDSAKEDIDKCKMGWMTRIHPIVTNSGRILLPLYSDGFNVSLCGISDDGGNSWYGSKTIVGLGPIQPSIVEKRNGDLVAYMRNSGESKRILKSVSVDSGDSWSVAVDTNIPNPGKSIEAISINNDSEWIMVFNDQEDDYNNLSVALSEDEGFTWKYKRKIAYSEDDGTSYTYPSVIQSTDGLIHVTYSSHLSSGNTIMHSTFSTDWIRG